MYKSVCLKVMFSNLEDERALMGMAMCMTSGDKI